MIQLHPQIAPLIGIDPYHMAGYMLRADSAKVCTKQSTHCRVLSRPLIWSARLYRNLPRHSQIWVQRRGAYALQAVATLWTGTGPDSETETARGATPPWFSTPTGSNAQMARMIEGWNIMCVH